ncbi:DUF3300 domain-containing protein, partial [Escherichia sp. R-CC3]
MLEEYRKHVAERAAEGIAPKPLDANQMAALVELLKNPPAGEEEFLLDLLTNRVPPGVDEAAYVKAGFLAAIAKGEAKSPLLTPEKAIELLGTMQGGYNIHPLIDALDDAKLAPIAAKALSHTLLMFDNFYDVEEKAKAGNEYAKQVMQSWADAEWFLNRPALAEKLTVTVITEPATTVISIEPANPDVVYIPNYNPTVVYGNWANTAYPPVYLPPPAGEPDRHPQRVPEAGIGEDTHIVTHPNK